MSVPVLVFPTMFTSTPWVAEVALMLIDDWPASEMLLKLYCAAGLAATRTMLTCDDSETLGSESVAPAPLITMSLPLVMQVAAVNPRSAHAVAVLLMFCAAIGDGLG